MKFKYASISSGSCGNCHYINYKDTSLLVDSGLSGKKTQENLNSLNIDPKSINAILITHEHKDHIKGAGILSRRFDLPIYANEKTWSAMEKDLGKINDKNIKIINKNNKFNIEDIEIKSFEINHDAIDPVGYTFFNGKDKIGFITDVGLITDHVKENILGSKLVVLESNHDEEMLKIGPYPYYLKKRVLSKLGHLSNTQAGNFAAELVKAGAKNILLAHLSGENNFPALAFETVKQILFEKGIKVNEDFSMAVLKRQESSCLYEI
ncbi:MBL fold metallo-hydrolase [Peptostreptococcaceae bacterium AGR-M142]